MRRWLIILGRPMGGAWPPVALSHELQAWAARHRDGSR